ncbi:MAG TPA: DNA methyltransferase [Bacilli bacterium]|nr:DNA methyltransferase [Bacilli bacterium]
MTPTDILGNIKLYNADCMEVMKTFKDKQFDLAIADPPYGIGDTFIGFSSGAKKGKLERVHKEMKWDDNIPSEEYFAELKRVSKKQIIWGANYFNSFNKEGGALVWYKNRGGNTLSQCEIASVSGQKKVDYVALQILTGFVADEERIHPTQKPVKLYKWLLQDYAKHGDTILDTHFGSLSIGIACHDMKFDLTAIESDKDHYEQAKQRLINHQRQLTLF